MLYYAKFQFFLHARRKTLAFDFVSTHKYSHSHSETYKDCRWTDAPVLTCQAIRYHAAADAARAIEWESENGRAFSPSNARNFHGHPHSKHSWLLNFMWSCKTIDDNNIFIVHIRIDSISLCEFIFVHLFWHFSTVAFFIFKYLFIMAITCNLHKLSE